MPRVEETMRGSFQRVYEQLFHIETEKRWSGAGKDFGLFTLSTVTLKQTLHSDRETYLWECSSKSSLIILHDPFDRVLEYEAQLPLAILVIFEGKPGNTDA